MFTYKLALASARNIIFSAAALFAALSSAQAQTSDPLPFQPDLRFGNTVLTENDLVTANADGSYTLVGGQGGTTWQMDWDLTLKQDPFIVGTLTVTNLSAVARDFNITLGLPITPAFSSSVYGGSLNATVTDLNGNLSASLSTSATSASIYRGTIDGSPVLQLFAIGVSCSGSSAGCTASGSDQDGLPGPTLLGPAVNTSIGTLLSFNLSAGDRVVFNTNFTVMPVPLPAALPLFVSGFVGLFGLRRRRRLLAQRD
ncbi:MAG: hypothetical protein H7Y02_02470 [Candidatus Obscuribacterales bacterium]|nr:hypothetical protein [Steroidobacteraceae bacterium]